MGPGLADACGVGEVFASPSAEQVYRCTQGRVLWGGRAYAYGNYSG